METPTSLSKLPEYEWRQIRSGYLMFGPEHYVRPVGRKWEVSERISAGFPLFSKKAHAAEAVRTLLRAETAYRLSTALKAAAKATGRKHVE